MSKESPTANPPASETWKHYLELGCLKILHHLRRASQFPADLLTKKLFLAAYEASDDAYWRNHETQCEWRSLNGIIEYTPDLLAVTGEQATPTYLIAIRASSDTYLERVVIKVKAKKSGVIHQQEITQSQLYGTPVCKALTAIPLKPKSSKGGDWQKLGDLYIKLAEAVDCDGVDLVKGKKIADIFASTSTDIVAHCQVERWGQYWNTDEINVEKENIRTGYYRELVQSAKKLGRPLTMRRMAYRLLTSPLGLTLTFWSENLWSAKGIRDSVAQTDVNGRLIRHKNSKAMTASRNTNHAGEPAEVSS
jgi:hypothetical protein